jgi:cysteinyl-tRNA synthetase
MLSTHYRKPMDWTEEKAREAESVLRKWRNLAAEYEIGASSPYPPVLDAIADDLNTANALSVLHQLFDKLRRQRNSEVHASSSFAPSRNYEVDQFVASAKVLGLLSDELGDWWFDEADTPSDSFIARVEIELMERSEAKKNRDFKKADEIRQRLACIGIMISDGKDGTTWMLDHGNPNVGAWDKY